MVKIISEESKLPRKDRAKRFFFPKKVYGRKVRKEKIKGIRTINPPGVSVLKKAFPSKRQHGRGNGMQSATDWFFG